jgi:D-3-phosphoglycerate dehydrogenase / 2-oxoglutarate reductase
MARVLITTEALRELPGPHLDRLAAAGHEVSYPEQVVLLTEDDTLREMQGFDAAIAGSEPYTDRVLAELAPRLRVISRNGVGYDQIDVAAATVRNIAVTITPAGNHGAVAEHAFALMLAVARRIVTGAVDTKAGHWRRRLAFIPLRGSTLGIVGLGRIGCSVATRAKAFGMRVIACDQFPNRKFAQECGIELVELDEILAQSDFITLHAPSTPETRDLINRQSLARMKPGSVLINTARGGLVNEADLYDALKSGHLAGAGLDVLKVEPPAADHPLLSLDNVIVTPHLAAFDTQAREDMATGAAQNIIDLLAGRWPEGSVVNPEVRGAFERA